MSNFSEPLDASFNPMVDDASVAELSDRELFETLVDRHYHQIKKLAFIYCKDPDMAEDIAQDVFLNVYRQLHKFRKKSSYYTWIYRITVNQCKDFLKSAYKTHSLPTDFDVFPCIDEKTENAFLQIEAKEVLKVIDQLTPSHKQVIILYYYNELSTKEIAKVLHLKESSVRTRLTRGRQQLKDLLKD